MLKHGLYFQFVDELCDTVTQSLPDFWSLCQAYLDGSLLPETTRPPLTHQDSVLSPPVTPRPQPPSEQVTYQLPFFSYRTKDFKGGIVYLY